MECIEDRCKCRSIGCTVFCKCEEGPTCKNPLTKMTTERTEQVDEIDQESVVTSE